MFEFKDINKRLGRTGTGYSTGKRDILTSQMSIGVAFCSTHDNIEMH